MDDIIEVEIYPIQVPFNQVRFDQVDQMWDGPLSGTAFYEDRMYYFSMVHQDGETDNRTYQLIYLNIDQIMWEMDRTLYWRACQVAGQYEAFYDRYPPEKHDGYKDNTVIGYFTEGS